MTFKIPLAVPNYGTAEILECMESLLSTEVTMGKKVRRFEEMWAAYVTRKYTVAVNSGSSANLLAVSWLASKIPMIPFVTEVIVPATTWSTTVAPFLQYNFRVVFADIDASLCLDPQSVQNALSTQTKAIAIVPLLGNAYDPNLLAVAQQNGLLVQIDACEGHGAKLNMKDVGAFGDIATWSFFMSHHCSTIEGGMVATDDEEASDFLRAVRAHGWIRERSDAEQLADTYQEIDRRFLFIELGYNLRPTELMGAFGIHQVPKLEEIVAHRRKIVDAWTTYLEEYKEWFILPSERQNSRNSYFGFPLIMRPGAPFTRRDLADFLHGVQIDTRPIMGGDLRRHPAFTSVNSRSVPTPMTDLIYTNGLFVGVHNGVGPEEEQYFIDMMDVFLRKQ